MPISLQKTHISNDSYEFAKRWVYQGQEITGFSISGLYEVRRSYSLLHNFLSNQADHGWLVKSELAPVTLSSLYKVLGLSQQGERVQKLYNVFNSLSIAKSTDN